MNNRIPCGLIRDLGPLYAEHLTSEETKGLVEEHLRECQECREHYAILMEETETEKQTREEQNTVEIDYMKRIRAYQRGNLILGAVISFFLGLFLPVSKIGFSVFVNHGLSDYQWARLKVAWHIGILQMLVSGVIICCLYLLVNFVLRKRK